NQIRNGNLVAVRAKGNAAGHNGNQIRCYNCRGLGHFARDCTVRPRRKDVAYLQTQLFIAQKEEAGIQLQAEEYDLTAAAADLDEIEEYTELLEPILEPQQVPQNDNNVISEVTDVEQGVETVEQHSANFEETPAVADLDEIEEVNANYILMANLQQALTSGSQTDKALIYDSDGSAEVHNYENCYDNEIFNMFTQEEQYTELLEPILEPQ
nr:hypothetical protein [Tanacetum cinerariifolium]